MSEWTPPAEVLENPGRIADKHTAFLFEAEYVGAHVHVKVRAATRILSAQVNHSRGLCGELVMAPAEWVLFKKALEGAPTPGPTWVRDGASAMIYIGAGHPALEDCVPPEVETDHDQQRFITIDEAVFTDDLFRGQ